jgi:hypothetical protein
MKPKFEEFNEEVETPEPVVETPKQVEEALDADEAEFQSIRCDLPGVKGAGAVGIVAIAVSKKPPGDNTFFRTHPDFRPVVPIVTSVQGIEKRFFAVTPNMREPLTAIGVKWAYHTLYLTVTEDGAVCIVPVRRADEEGVQNEYDRTKEIGLVKAIDEWQRLYADQQNRCYKSYPGTPGRRGEPQWPELKESKIFRLAFRDRGCLINSPEHPMYKKWADRETERSSV